MKIGFIGAGQMATALAQGFVRAKLLPATSITAFDPVQAATDKLGKELAGLVVANFFWMGEKGDKADKKKPGVENLAKAIQLDGKEAPGWELLGAAAADPTGTPFPDRKDTICAPADPTFNPQELEALLAEARYSMDAPAVPQIVITIAARFGRVSWKYSSLAYALILKDVGALTQTLYLMATDMGLGGCAIGSTNIDLVAKMPELEFHVEGAVGQFALGRGKKPEAPR